MSDAYDEVTIPHHAEGCTCSLQLPEHMDVKREGRGPDGSIMFLADADQLRDFGDACDRLGAMMAGGVRRPGSRKAWRVRWWAMSELGRN